MIVARASGDHGEEMLLLGLSRLNIERLLKGCPIHLEQPTHAAALPRGWTILIAFGETEQAILDTMREAGCVTEETLVIRRAEGAEGADS